MPINSHCGRVSRICVRRRPPWLPSFAAPPLPSHHSHPLMRASHRKSSQAITSHRTTPPSVANLCDHRKPSHDSSPEITRKKRKKRESMKCSFKFSEEHIFETDIRSDTQKTQQRVSSRNSNRNSNSNSNSNSESTILFGAKLLLVHVVTFFMRRSSSC